jgi:FAD synthetase
LKLQELAYTYIRKAEKVFEDLEQAKSFQPIDASKVENVLDEAKRYLEDAKYYYGKGTFETSLASVAYCEGLLDALRILGLVIFYW